MAELRSEYSGQAPKKSTRLSPTCDDVDALIADADRLIESVYRDINFSSIACPSDTAIDSVRERTPLRTPPKTPRQLEIDRINRFLSSLDEDEPPTGRQMILDEEDMDYRPRLNSAFIADQSLHTPTSGRRIRDLDSNITDVYEHLPAISLPRRSSSRGHPDINTAFLTSRLEEDDDDVIIVSSNLPSVVDLCTPVNEPRTVRRVSTERRRPNLLSPPRNSYRSRSPRQSQDVGTRSVHTSTTHIQQPQQQRQLLLPNQTPPKQASARDKANTSGDSYEQPILMCPVCMESSVKRKPTSTKCGHVFCETCINQALRLTHKCPICNTKLTNRMLFRIYL